ncbi:hypothetical protein NST77_10635 [Niallia sp. FSL W8-0177]
MDEQVLIDVVKGLSSAKRIVISLDAGKTGWIVKNLLQAEEGITK